MSMFLGILLTLASLLADDAPTTQPAEVRRGMRMDEPPEMRYRSYYTDLAKRIEPDGVGHPDRAALYLNFFVREIVRDTRMFVFDIRTSLDEESTIHLTGIVEYREQLDSLVRLLETLGLKVDQRAVGVIEADRSAELFGIVSAARTFLNRSFTEESENVNEMIAGEPVWTIVSDAHRKMFLCHAVDGYVGWVRATDVKLVDAKHFDAAVNIRPVQHHDRIEAIIAEAQSRMGKPYIWGGRSEEGVDCSGLVQQAFASQGIHLPRDAEQQALVGRLVATRWHRSALRRGDLLFFMGRRGLISHTGIYLGDGKFIESADGGVKVSAFEPDSKRFETFCFAKRVLD